MSLWCTRLVFFVCLRKFCFCSYALELLGVPVCVVIVSESVAIANEMHVCVCFLVVCIACCVY